MCVCVCAACNTCAATCYAGTVAYMRLAVSAPQLPPDCVHRGRRFCVQLAYMHGDRWCLSAGGSDVGNIINDYL